jgi:hypothetical protein
MILRPVWFAAAVSAPAGFPELPLDPGAGFVTIFRAGVAFSSAPCKCRIQRPFGRHVAFVSALTAAFTQRRHDYGRNRRAKKPTNTLRPSRPRFEGGARPIQTTHHQSLPRPNLFRFAVFAESLK